MTILRTIMFLCFLMSLFVCRVSLSLFFCVCVYVYSSLKEVHQYKIVIKLTGTTCALYGFNAHIPANRNQVFRHSINIYIIYQNLQFCGGRFHVGLLMSSSPSCYRSTGVPNYFQLLLLNTAVLLQLRKKLPTLHL